MWPRFLLVWGINYARSGSWTTALLRARMRVVLLLPQKLPVAFSGVMALGTAPLRRLGVLTKQPHRVESLSLATVICADKTGALARKGMCVRQLYNGAAAALVALPEAGTGPLSATAGAVLAYAYWSERKPAKSRKRTSGAGIRQVPGLYRAATLSVPLCCPTGAKSAA